MVEVVRNIENLINQISKYIDKSSEEEMSRKRSPKKWSKKEILGHLVDSGINNLQRFTEIQFEEKPYQLKSYNQDELVLANKYQNSKADEILNLLVALNHRIVNIIKQQTQETLNYPITAGNTDSFNLKFLIQDYVRHLEHHIKQITEQN